MADALSDDDRARVSNVLELWFPEREFGAPQIDARLDLWFSASPELDARLRLEFIDDITAASERKLQHWGSEPESRVALILLIDQFRRNIYRGTPKAFSHDRIALKLAVEGIIARMDRKLNPIHRVFFYMPLQHAESLRVQKKSVQVFSSLAGSVSETLRQTFETFAQFAELHHDIIARFGRFPHRNAILGRPNTQEEETYLSDDAPGFGQ